jgi:hypothetical protein
MASDTTRENHSERHSEQYSPAWALLFAAVIAFAIWIRIANPPPPTRTPDERCYMNYARLAMEAPLQAPSAFVTVYNRSPANWIYPIPLRIAYFYSIAGIMKLAVVALFALRFFNRPTALIAVVLLSVCPQDLAMARRVWGDGASGCAAMIFLWICAEISMRPKAKPWFAALWICGFYFLLLKETGAFFYGFCILGLALQTWRRDRSWKPVAWLLAGAAITALSSFALMATLCGGVAAALDTVRHSAQAAPANPYGVSYQSGPWYSFLFALWVLSPLSAIGAVVGLAALILPRDSLRNVLSLNETQRDITFGVGAMILLVIAAATLPPALKNLRYISLIAGPWYVMAALGLTYIAAQLRELLGPRSAGPVIALMVISVLFSCRSDYFRYRELYLRRNIPDLNIRQVVTSPFESAS